MLLQVLVTNNTELYENAIASDIFCYKLQTLKDGIVSKPVVSFDVTKIQEPNVENFVFQVANDYKASGSGKKDQIHVNCFRKRLFEDITDDTKESQNVFLCKNKKKSSKNFNTNQRIINDGGTTSEIGCDITSLNLNASFEVENEPMTKDNRFEKDLFCHETFQYSSEMAVNKFHIQNSNKRKLVLNEMLLTDKQKENEGNCRSEFENQDLFLTDRVMEVNQPARRELESINRYTIESHLKKFVIRSEIIKERILSRFDEWKCCFTQTMEDVLAEFQPNHDVSMMPQPPWPLQEAIDYIKELFDENDTIKIITQKLSSLLCVNGCTNSTKVTTISPNSFMLMIGCSILLIKCLKNNLRDSPEILEGENKLEKLLQNIESPSGDTESQLIKTPVVSRSELIEPPMHRRNCKFLLHTEI